MVVNQSEVTKRGPLSERVKTEERPLEIIKFDDEGRLVDILDKPADVKAVSTPYLFTLSRSPSTLGDILYDIVERIKSAASSYHERWFPETANAVALGDEVRRGPQPVFNPTELLRVVAVQLYTDVDPADRETFRRIEGDGSLKDLPVPGTPVGPPLFRFTPRSGSYTIGELMGDGFKLPDNHGLLFSDTRGYSPCDWETVIPIQFYGRE